MQFALARSFLKYHRREYGCQLDGIWHGGCEGFEVLPGSEAMLIRGDADRRKQACLFEKGMADWLLCFKTDTPLTTIPCCKAKVCNTEDQYIDLIHTCGCGRVDA